MCSQFSILVISRFGFNGGISVLIDPVLGHFLLFILLIKLGTCTDWVELSWLIRQPICLFRVLLFYGTSQMYGQISLTLVVDLM